ncbi:hypothetical protein TGRUB_291650 [Toxoplasma gondii RUB]|uniref:Uncharacterized protein n=1 Tax=Toxoplasma gondii RUB TaxID=935652 RepID=A0A086M1V5_TOXGO|nr:hypothetical protein TGRUB_291650 [Toxoplasma gondii RUB]
MRVQRPTNYVVHSQRTLPQWKWNAYAEAPPAPLLASGVVADEDMSVPALVRTYQAQITALTHAHEEIMRDKVRLERLMEPYVCPKTRELVAEPSEDILLLKKGFDIRLQQFNEDCRKASKLEWIIQRKLVHIEEKEDKWVATHPCQVEATCRALKKVKDQGRLIKILQHELDECLYFNDLYAEQLRKMRNGCSAGVHAGRPQPTFYTVRTLHQDFETSFKHASDWVKAIRVNPLNNVIPRLREPPPPEGPFEPGFEPPRDAPLQKPVEQHVHGAQAAKPGIADGEGTMLSQLFKALGGITEAAADIKKTVADEMGKDRTRRRSREPSREPAADLLEQVLDRHGTRDVERESMTSPRGARRSPRPGTVSPRHEMRPTLARDATIRSMDDVLRKPQRTISSPRLGLRLGTRTLRSPRSIVDEQPAPSLSRAMSSAFLGG